MDSSELNKLAGAFLGVVFVVMSVALLSDVIFHTETPEEFGYAIEAVEAEHGGSGEEAVDTVSIATLMASADAAAGEGSFKKCAACHTVEEGGANKVGPNLWNVVNRPIASHEGFSYSTAMQEFSEGGAVAWDYEHLDGFLKSPKGYIKGTAMGFVGLKKDDERANVIAYLREQAASPAPLPEPEAPEAAASGEADPAAPAAESAGEESTATEGEAPAETEPDAGATTDTPSAADPAAAEQPAETQPGASPSAADPLPTPADNPVAAPAGETPAETQPDPVESAPVEAAPAETVPAEPAPAQ